MASRPARRLRTPRSRSSEVRIAGRMSEIAKVADLVETFGEYHRLPSEVVFALGVALDEILNNVISYAYDDPSGHEIMVRLTLRHETVEAVVHDKGRPFNPLMPPDGMARTDNRLGVGLHFVRALTDEIHYARRDGTNRLRLLKRTT
jgi:serine/threonine-protein kinase RsbW